MNIGKRIYYELSTGNIVLDTGERSGDVVQTSVDQDYTLYHSLVDKVPESIGVIELEYGQYRDDFASCIGVRVVDGQLSFTYPTSEPTSPITPDKPLSTQFAEYKAMVDDINVMLADMIMGGA